MAQSKHDQVANRIAKKEGVKYNKGQGADVQSSRRAIEVETAQTVNDASRQLRGYRKPVYVAGVDDKAVKIASKKYKGTSIGVMRPSGKIVKRSSRSRKK
ncbi:MAG: hypothetical protein JRF31_13905 [Deltaproteobacteria bacterium]|nr:hypothetical protein [Deltaproteobacteria bacterium]